MTAYHIHATPSQSPSWVMPLQLWVVCLFHWYIWRGSGGSHPPRAPLSNQRRWLGYLGVALGLLLPPSPAVIPLSRETPIKRYCIKSKAPSRAQITLWKLFSGTYHCDSQITQTFKQVPLLLQSADQTQSWSIQWIIESWRKLRYSD